MLLLGVEPNVRWKTFAGLVVGLAKELGVELVVTLGSLLADVPHTRPAPVTGAASDPKLVEELGLEHSRYEGPTGIVGVLLDACRREGLPGVSLWSAVPHYVSLAPSPRAARALVERLSVLLGCAIDTEELVAAEEAYADQVSEAVASDAETTAYVEELERRVDMVEELTEPDDLPSGESLAAELTRFLRERESAVTTPSQPPRRLGLATPVRASRRSGRRPRLSRPGVACAASTACPAPAPSVAAAGRGLALGAAARRRRSPPLPFPAALLRRRDLRVVVWVGRFSTSAFPISSIGPISPAPGRVGARAGCSPPPRRGRPASSGSASPPARAG